MGVASITARIIVQLQGIDGTGSYTYDVSGTDQVQRGIAAEPTRDPQVWVASTGTTEEDGPELGCWQETGSWQIVGYVAAAADTTTSRGVAAEDLLEDIKRALRTDRNFNDQVSLIGMDALSFDGQEADLGLNCGVAVVRLTARWLEDPP